MKDSRQALRPRGGHGQAPRDARRVGVRRRRACRSTAATATPRSTRRAGSWSTRASCRSSKARTRSRRTSSRAACSNERRRASMSAQPEKVSYRSPRYGRLLEDFEVGAVYEHPWEVTVDAGHCRAVCRRASSTRRPSTRARATRASLGFRDRPVHPLLLLNFGSRFSRPRRVASRPSRTSRTSTCASPAPATRATRSTRRARSSASRPRARASGASCTFAPSSPPRTSASCASSSARSS